MMWSRYVAMEVLPIDQGQTTGGDESLQLDICGKEMLLCEENDNDRGSDVEL